jgi:23S rRNA maturation-related 3'-5' exoribonuclease YhaM
MLNVYKDIYEIIASMSMNIIVAAGFLLDWQKNKSKNEKS